MREDDSAYRALFDANPHPMWLFNRESLRFLAVNDAALRQYGYSREGFLDLTILDIRPEDDATLVRQSIAEGFDTGRVWRHRRRDTSTFLVEITANDVEFLGKPARLVLALDVNEREKHAAQIRRTNRTLDAVLRTAPVGLVVVDPNGAVAQINDEARRLLGNASVDELEPTIKRALASESPRSAQIVEVDGRWIEIAASPIDMGLDASGAVVVLTDVTERRLAEGRLSDDIHNLEAQLREGSAALKASDDELEDFCFSVSHDLRGPLRAVDGFTQTVLTDPSVELSEENRNALERVRNAAKRMGRLIDGLLILSRLARAPLEPRWVDLSAIVRRTADALTVEHPDRKLSFDVAPGAKAYGDPRLLASLLERLLANAVKFTAGRGEACIDFFPEGEGWTVRDNGAGFDPAYRARLFRPFERLHTAREFPGDGLGLAVAYRIVRRHGGTLEAEGTPGSGASFRFVLPRP